MSSRVFFVAAVIFACATFSLAQAHQDAHTGDPAALLYSRSPFAHGYLHGYEEGFHNADQDLQMGRIARGIHTRGSAHPENKFQSDDPRSFRSGYQQGFASGYRDSAAGREFRAMSALRAVAAGIPDASPAAYRVFDRGFQDGYTAGQIYADKNVKPLTDFKYVNGFCVTTLYGVKTRQPRVDVNVACKGYTGGFQLGYADARIQQPAQTTASAKVK